MKILFIHGLASSGAYKMASSLRIMLKGSEVIAPDVPIRLGEALGMLERICSEQNPDLIIGLSWGGFLAQKFRGRRKMLINPDLHISRLLREKTGEQKYLSPRMNGDKTFTITEDICNEYSLSEEVQFDNITQEERLLTTGIFASGDELVHCGPEFELHYPGRAHYYPGGHLPNYPEIKTHILPLINNEILNQRID